MTERWDDDDRDPLIDAGLAEILGDTRPPDLTARILAALRSGQAAAASPASIPAAIPASNNGDAHHPIPVAHRIETRSAGPAAELPARSVWQMLASLAAVLLVGAGLGLAGVYFTSTSRDGDRPVIRHDGPPRITRDPLAQNQNQNQNPDQPIAAELATSDSSNSAADTDASPPGLSAAPADSVPFDSTPGSQSATSLANGNPNPPPRVEWPPALDPRQLVAHIDQLIQTAWQNNNITPASLADDAALCRRVYVRVLGRIPTVEEVRRYSNDSSPQKYAELVERLHQSSEYANEYASHWANFWTNVLMGNNPRLDLASRDGLFTYLRAAIENNKPLNQWVYELVAATGAARPGDADFNGAVNFLLANHSDDATTETAAISRIFLGQRLQCAQCHDHPTNEALAQSRFWEMDALLRQMAVEKNGEQVRLVNRDMPDNLVFFEEPDGRQRAALPVLPDRTPLPESGRLADVNRRERLAQWVSGSRELPQVIVNRLWADFFGYGLSSPIDDLGPHNPSNHPQLLQTITEQFAAHQFNHRQLTQWLATTNAFRRSSEPPAASLAQDTPELGDPAWFSRYYTRQMQPEAIFDSLRLVAEARRSGTSEDILKRFTLLNPSFDPNKKLLDDPHPKPDDTATRLAPFTAALVQRATSSEDGAVLRQVIQSNMSPEEKIEHLFLAAVARKPQPNELELGLKMVNESNVETALQDIWWALLNSSEFILDH